MNLPTNYARNILMNLIVSCEIEQRHKNGHYRIIIAMPLWKSKRKNALLLWMAQDSLWRKSQSHNSIFI